MQTKHLTPYSIAVINYTSALLVDAKNRFSGSSDAAVVRFFMCLVRDNRTTESEQWFRLKDNIERVVFTIADEAGDIWCEGGAKPLCLNLST